MTWPTPSKLALAERCVYPWHRVAPAWPDVPPSADAAFGSAFHAAMACAAVFGVSPELLSDLAERHGLTPADRRRLELAVAAGVDEVLDQRSSEVTWRAPEVSILYDVERDAARVLPEPLQRDQIPPGHIHGTIDLLEVHAGQLVVSDWKTGARTDVAPSTSPQLRTYALQAARAMGHSSVVVVVLYASEDGVVPVHHRLDALELAVVRGELLRTLGRVDAGGPPVPGRHCVSEYCPIVGECPATQRALAEVQAAAEAQLPMRLEIDSPDTARRVRLGVRAVERALEQYRAALHAWVDAHGSVELEPGVLYGRVEREGNERVEAETPGAQAALRELLGDEADLALEVSTSKAAIERAARAHAKAKGITGRGALKQVVEPVLERLRHLGAIRQGAPSVRYDEINTKKAKGEAAA